LLEEKKNIDTLRRKKEENHCRRGRVRREAEGGKKPQYKKKVGGEGKILRKDREGRRKKIIGGEKSAKPRGARIFKRYPPEWGMRGRQKERRVLWCEMGMRKTRIEKRWGGE